MLRAEAAPRSITQSAGAAARLLGLGVKSGVAGLVSKPRKGLKAGGPGGLIKGVAKGALGVVVKPVVGVFDAVACSTRAIAVFGPREAQRRG